MQLIVANHCIAEKPHGGSRIGLKETAKEKQ